MRSIKIDIKGLNKPVSFSKRAIEFWKFYLSNLIKRFDEHHLFLSGAGIAYSLLLSFIPFILVVFTIFNSIIRQDIIELQIKQWIDAIIPYSEYSEYVKEELVSRLPDLISYKTWAGWFGTVGFIFSASTLFSSMRTILNKVYCVKLQRNAIVGLLRDMGMVVMLLFIVFMYTFVMPIYNSIYEGTDNLKIWEYYRQSGLSDTFVWLTSIAFIFGMFYLVYKVIPYGKLRKKVVIVSAFWGTLMWEGTRSVFGYWAKNFIATNKLYGAFGLIIVLLLWVYCLSLIFIIGAEIGQLYEERNKPVPQKQQAGTN